MANLEMPLWPEEWREGPADASSYAPDVAAGSSANFDNLSGGILDGWQPPGWRPVDSGLHAFFDPETIASFDFSRDGKTLSVGNEVQAGQMSEVPLADKKDPAGASAPAPRLASDTAKDGWAQLPRPKDVESGEAGSGYYTYGTDKRGKPGTAANAQWGAPKAMEVIGAAANKLATADQYTPFGVGNISLQNGADFSPDHKGHRDGLGIDVRPARTDGAQAPVTHKDSSYDRAATQRLVDAFRATGQISKIYFNDPQIRGVMPLSGHDDHLHIQLNP
jgi:hypothetical protein